jgi:hypothetical protein
MENNCLISEKIRVDVEAFGPTTAGSTSMLYDMSKFRSALIAFNVNSTLGVNGQIVDLVESSAETVAGTTAAASKAGIELGSTVSTAVSTARGARELLLTPATVTGSFTLTVNGITKRFTHSTISTLLTTLATAVPPSTVWTSTQLYFGSTIDSTSDGSLQAHAETLRVAINSTHGFGGFAVASTPSTGQLLVAANGEGVGNLGFASTAATVMGGLVSRASGGFNIKAEDLNSTANKRYIGVRFTTQATTCVRGVAVLRDGARYTPDFAGLLSS